MDIIKNYLLIGVKEPFCVLRASDTHIAFADNREIERKITLSEQRKTQFPSAKADLKFLKKKAQTEQKQSLKTDLFSKTATMLFCL